MVSQIAATITQSAEQVRARHIVVATQDEAVELRVRIVGGESFYELAQIFSLDASTRPAGGDLGWFPKGFLLWPELDTAAFELAPGELSAVVQSEVGYHLVETLDRGESSIRL